jgi:hypothetical protein
MRLAVTTSLTLAGLAVAGMALANIPDQNQSTFGNRLGRSPKNLEVTGGAAFQYTYSGVLRNAVGAPIANWPAADILLEIVAPCQNPVQLTPIGNSDVNGNVTWNATKLDQGGGSCIGAGVADVRIVSIGIFKTLNEVTSPDENGSTVVDIVDLGIFQQAFTNGAPTYQGDLNLSGGPPDVADLGFFQQHFTAP